MRRDLTYAIDFGTSNSLLAAAGPEGPLPPAPLDPTASDPTVLRSVFYTPKAGEWYFGASAITEYGAHYAEGRMLRSIKKYLPDEAFIGTLIHDRRFNLSELIAVFLKNMREKANAHYGADATRVVLGRPAVFHDDPELDKLAEQRLHSAATLAGFKEISFCPEPVAAAYEFRHQLDEPKTVLIADFGGGTSDFTVLRMGRERFSEKDLLAMGGLSIAGDRFDGALMKGFIAPHFGTGVTYRLPLGSNDLSLPKHLVERLCSPPDISFLARKDIMQLLKDSQRWALAKSDGDKLNRLFVLIEDHLGYQVFKSIEEVKIALSSAPTARFVFDYPGIGVEDEIAGADFKSFAAELVGKITAALDDTVQRAGLTHAEIDIVCCTGGTAKLPALRRELERRFGEAKLREHRHFHSIINGLADRAHALYV